MNLKGYHVVLSKRAKKNLKKINKKDSNTILDKLNSLVTREIKHDVKKIVGKNDLYRLRSGYFRIIYTIYKHKVVVLVVDIGYRKEVYKNLVW